MCIAILNKKGTIDKETLRTCEINNPDGMGMAWVKKGKIQILKQMKNFEGFYREYKSIRKSNDLPIMLHFRISTGGKLNTKNCHPFRIDNTCAFMHNGIMNDFSYEKDNGLTDTIHFRNEVLRQLDRPFYAIQNPGIERLIQASIGYSKLVFLNNEGKYYIINEDLGKWEGENWYSNDSYVYCKARRGTTLGEVWNIDSYNTDGKSSKKPNWTDKKTGEQYHYDIATNSWLLVNDPACEKQGYEKWDMCPYCSQTVRTNDMLYNATFNDWICADCEAELEAEMK